MLVWLSAVPNHQSILFSCNFSLNIFFSLGTGVRVSEASAGLRASSWSGVASHSPWARCWLLGVRVSVTGHVCLCACVSVRLSVCETCAQLGCWLTLGKWQLLTSAWAEMPGPWAPGWAPTSGQDGTGCSCLSWCVLVPVTRQEGSGLQQLEEIARLLTSLDSPQPSPACGVQQPTAVGWNPQNSV